MKKGKRQVRGRVVATGDWQNDAHQGSKHINAF